MISLVVFVEKEDTSRWNVFQEIFYFSTKYRVTISNVPTKGVARGTASFTATMAPPPPLIRVAPRIVSRVLSASPAVQRGVGIAAVRSLCTVSTPGADRRATASRWFWRGVGVMAVGAGVGSAAVYANDPEGTRELVLARVRYFSEPSRDKLLPPARAPFPGAPAMRTLVVDLEETLVHSSYSRTSGWRVAKRPGAEAFLAYLASFYEIVVFTGGLNTYADPILDRLDPNGYIMYRLYRPETKYEHGVHIKDLGPLNRDLSKVVLIDNDPKHYKYHPENAIHVPRWTEDPSDTALLDLIPFLEGMVREDVPDVRTELAHLKGKPIASAVAEYRALAATRAEHGSGRQGLLWGVADSGYPPPAEPDKGEAPKGAAWSSLATTSKLFHPPQKLQSDSDGQE